MTLIRGLSLGSSTHVRGGDHVHRVVINYLLEVAINYSNTQQSMCQNVRMDIVLIVPSDVRSTPIHSDISVLMLKFMFFFTFGK